MMSMISHQDLNSEVLLNLLPMSPGLASKRTRAGPTGCAIDIWIRACPTGISFQVLVFSFHSLYLTAVTGVWKRKRESERAKATSSFCLTLRLTRQRDYKTPGMCSWAEQPSCPDTWLPGSWAGVWLSVCGEAQPRLVVSRRSMLNPQRILGGVLAPTASSENSGWCYIPLFPRLQKDINI